MTNITAWRRDPSDSYLLNCHFSLEFNSFNYLRNNSLNTTYYLMKKNSSFLLAGLLAFLLCFPLEIMAQNGIQRESKLRDVLSARQGSLVMGSTLNMPVGSVLNLEDSPLQVVGTPMQKMFSAPIIKAPATGTVLWGNVIHQEGWKVGAAPYGMYSFNTTPPIEVNAIGLHKFMEVNSGSGIVGGVFHAMYLDFMAYSGGRFVIHHYTYDIDTWEQLSDDDLGQDGLTLCAMETAQDRNTGKVYGIFWDESGTNLQWGTVDYSTMKRNFIGWAEHQFIALGISNEGVLYGVSTDGDLYSISTTNGTETLIGSTGVTVKNDQGKYYLQSGEIDQKTNTFYWASIDTEGKSVLYNVDLATGRANKISDMPSESQVLAMTVPVLSSAPNAPARIEDLKMVFDKGNTTGRVQFTAPDKTVDGNSLTGNLTYYVVANNDTVKQGTAQAGSKVDAELTVPGGDTKFLVTTANAAGSSPKVRYSAWVGFDIPANVEKVKFSFDGTTARITWPVVTQGVHGGYVGKVKYDVKRMPDGMQVGTDLDDNKTSMTFSVSGLKKYTFVITPKAGNQTGKSTTSNGIVIGEAIQPPFKETFIDEESFENFTPIDANDDGETWEWGLADDFKGRAQSGYNMKGAADDWLLSPPMELRTDRLYNISFDAYNVLASQYTEVMELAYGMGYNPKTYTKISEPTIVPKEQTKFSYEIRVPQDGSYFFGIHDRSSYAQWRFYVRNFEVKPGSLLSAPDASTNFNVTVDQTGAEKAALSFTMPTKTIEGKELKAQLDSAVIYRDNIKLALLSNPARGAQLSYQDNNVAKGFHIYKIVVYNQQGAGREAVKKAFVGPDVPAAPTGLKARDNNTSASLSWDKISTTGANGGVVFPNEVTYNVINMRNAKEPADTLASFKDRTGFDVQSLNLNDGDQHFIYWGVSATNKQGAGALSTTRLVAGKPYNVPFRESFANASLSTLVWLAETKGASWKICRGLSADNDGGSLCFESSKLGEQSILGTGKISLVGTTNPKLVFQHRFDNFCNTKIIVFAQKPDGTRTELRTIDYSKINKTEKSWITEVVPLADFEDERYIFIGFKAVGENVPSLIYIDNIRVSEVSRYNLAVTASGSKKVIKGRDAKIDVTVENIGERQADDFIVRIKSASGKEISHTTVSESLESFKKHTVSFNVPTSSIDAQAEEMKVIAEVEYEDDLDKTDNKTELTIRLEDSEKPQVTNLRGSKEQQTVSLTWNAPSKEPQTVTEDFERYDPWSTEFGDWTLIDANKGYAGGFFDNLWYPNQFTQFAYIIFNPNVLGEDIPRLNPWLLALSGRQYAAVPYELNASGQAYVNSDNWIISPKLSGQAQTISFYVHNMTVNDIAYVEDYDVLLSTTGNEIANFTDIVIENRQAVSGEWEKITINVPAGTAYFAIHQKTHQTGLMFGIDDVTFTKATPVPTHYGIYRSGERIDLIGADKTSYVDNAPTQNGIYAVTAIYADGTESKPVEVNITTALDNIENDGKPIDIYTVDGKLVRRQATSLDGLRKGVYLVGNKKVIVK